MNHRIHTVGHPAVAHGQSLRLIPGPQQNLRRFIRALGFAILILPAIASAQSGYVTHTVPSSLTSQVNTLVTSATSQQQNLRAATLQWALNQAASQFAVSSTAATVSFLAGDTVTVAAPSGVAPAGTTDLEYSPFGIGDGLVSDVQTNLSNDTEIGNPNTATYPLGLNLFPTIPNYPTGSGGQPVNPIAASIFTLSGTALSSPASEQAFGHPQSPYYGNYQMVATMFNQMESSYDSAFTNTNGSADFTGIPTLVIQYLTIAGRWPDLILPTVAKRWEASIYYTMNLYYGYNVSSTPITSSTAAQDRPWTEGDPSLAYPNQDFREAGPMALAAYIFQPPLNHNNYSSNVAANLKNAVNTYFNMALAGSSVEFPDGAFTYVYGSVEVGDYQNSETGPLGEDYQILQTATDTKEQAICDAAATMLERSRLYYPIEFPSQNYEVFDTAYPAWKVGFSASAGYEVSGLLYALAPGLSTETDPEMWRVLDENSPYTHENDSDLIMASCVDTSKDPFAGSAATAAASDALDYFTYDENREGPYGRFDKWTMVGSARMNHCDARGTASQAGFILNANGSQPSVNIGEPGNAVFTGTGASNFVNTMTWNSQNSTVVQPGFASLACMSTMAPHSGSALGFATIQEWIFTANRLVGFVTLWNPTATNQTAYGVGGYFDMHGSTDFASASGATPRLLYGQYGSAPYSYDMVANVKEDTYGNYVDSNGTAEFLDETTHNQRSYAPGFVGDYLVDFHPNANADAAEAKSISTGLAGVFGMEVEDGTQMYRLIHNTTASAITYTTVLPSGVWGSGSVAVHHAEIPAIQGSTVNNVPGAAETVGEYYRAAWMATNGHDAISSVESTYVPLSSGTFSYTVPPNSHILIMSIPNVTDGHIYEMEPENAPGMRLDVIGSGTVNGTATDLYSRNGWVNQKWLAEKQSDGSFIFVPQNATGSALDVAGGGTADGTIVDISASTGGANQKWRCVLQPTGYFQLEPENASGLALDVYKKATTNGTEIDVWANNGGTNQQWKLYDDTP